MKLCFVAPYTYSLFNEKNVSHFGGAEVRAHLIGRGLAQKSNTEISFVVFDHKQPSPEVYDNISVYAHPGYRSTPDDQAMPKLIRRYYEEVHQSGKFKIIARFPYRTFEDKRPSFVLKYLVQATYRLLGLGSTYLKQSIVGLIKSSIWINNYRVRYIKFHIYDQIEADAYCVFGVSNLSAEVAAYCKHAEKKFILFIAADLDLQDFYQPGSKKLNDYGVPGWLCHYAITQADLVFTQTQGQADLLRKRFGKDGIVVTNPVDLEQHATEKVPTYAERKIALWVGRADNFYKMPETLLRLAQAVPDVQFVMVMNKHQSDIEAQIYRDRTSNVTIYEQVPFKEIENLYAQAFVFVNTSASEGFPNTFLQAAKYRVPILSYIVDPDGFIERYQCGVVAHGDFDKLVSGLKDILADQQGGQHFSENIWQYVKANHDLDDKIDQIDKAITRNDSIHTI